MKNKKLILPLLTALLFTSCGVNGGTTTSSNDNQTSASLSEVIDSNFPFDEIKTFFNTDVLPPYFEGEEIFIEKSGVDDAAYVTVYTAKNDKASNEYFTTYLKTLGYDEPTYVNNDVEGEYYYVNPTSTLPYQVVYYEETIDGVTYFIVQYSLADSSSEEFIKTTSFPDAEIKSYLGLTESLVSFEASEYYYLKTTDSLGYTCFLMYILDGSMNASSYYTLLSNASYTMEELSDETGVYYDAYNEETGYEVLFWDDSTDDSFNLQIYSIYGGSTGGEEEVEYTEYTSFPGSNIKTFLNATAELPSYESDKYYYYEDNLLGLLNYVVVYSTISTTACNSAYKTILENASYIVEYDESDSSYYAYNETSGYSLYFYEDNGEFWLNIYEYFDYSEDDGGDTGGTESFTTTTTFPDNEIKTYLGTTNSIVSFEESTYYYAETYDGEYLCFYIYVLDGSMNASSYCTLLSNASYTVKELSDETGVYYDAYNEETGYEVLFWDDSTDNSFNLQIYAIETSTGGDNTDDDAQDGIKLVDTLFASSYGENTLTVGGVTFAYNNVMKSSQYQGTFQWKKSAGTMHNTTPLSGTTTLIIDVNYCFTTPSITVCGGTSVDSCNTEISPTVSGNTYTYDITSYPYISISNTGSNAFYLNSIIIK